MRLLSGCEGNQYITTTQATYRLEITDNQLQLATIDQPYFEQHRIRPCVASYMDLYYLKQNDKPNLRLNYRVVDIKQERQVLFGFING